MSTPHGLFVEVGVYKGGSAFELMKAARQQGRKLHLFDTFTGIPCARDFDSYKIGDFGDASLEAVQEALPDAIFHVGVFPDTLPGDLTEIAFVHADCDQYDSARAVIDHLLPRMVYGGIMAFDDYWATVGVTKACNESFPGMARACREGDIGWVQI